MLNETKRPLPSFQKWLEGHSPGTLAPDFKFFEDLMRRTQQQSFDGLKPHEASFLRMWQGALMAAVELCNMEALQYKRPNGEIIATLPRVFATATMYAIASVCKGGNALSNHRKDRHGRVLRRRENVGRHTQRTKGRR